MHNIFYNTAPMRSAGHCVTLLLVQPLYYVEIRSFFTESQVCRSGSQHLHLTFKISRINLHVWIRLIFAFYSVEGIHAYLIWNIQNVCIENRICMSNLSECFLDKDDYQKSRCQSTGFWEKTNKLKKYIQINCFLVKSFQTRNTDVLTVNGCLNLDLNIYLSKMHIKNI